MIPAKPTHTPSGAHQSRRSSTPFVGVTADGKPVYDRPSSHLHRLPEGLLAEAISRVRFGNGDFAKTVVHFGRVIGQSTCVETGPTDEIVYARRVGRNGFTRFVYDRLPIDCESVVVILKRMGPVCEDLILITAFIGSLCEPEPSDFNATSASADFWGCHALTWGSEPVERGTEKIECPEYWSPPTRTSQSRLTRPLPRYGPTSVTQNPR